MKKLLLFLLFVFLINSANAEMFQTKINGQKVDYYVPNMHQASIGGKPMEAKVLIADPTPVPNNYKPPKVNALTLGNTSKVTNTKFIVSYIPYGDYDEWGEYCYNFPDEAKQVFEAAGRAWANLIESSVPIRVKACWASFAGSTLGYSGSGATGNFVNAPYKNTYYKTALANALAHTDLDPNYDDIFITFNENFPWYYGLDGRTPSTEMDLFSVVMHEIAHGLNFSGGMKYDSGIGYLYANGYPFVWDHFVQYGSTPILNLSDQSSSLGAALTSNNLYFGGTKAKAANGGNKVKIYAPSTWARGSSYSHLDYNTFNNTPNQMMVYALSSGEAVHTPGDVAMGILQDMGWKTEAESSPSSSFYVIPIPGGKSVIIGL